MAWTNLSNKPQVNREKKKAAIDEPLTTEHDDVPQHAKVGIYAMVQTGPPPPGLLPPSRSVGISMVGWVVKVVKASIGDVFVIPEDGEPEGTIGGPFYRFLELEAPTREQQWGEHALGIPKGPVTQYAKLFEKFEWQL